MVGLRLLTVGSWNHDDSQLLRVLSDNSAKNEVYLLRALAATGDCDVLRNCVEMIETGEQGARCDATTIAAELGNRRAAEFIRLVFESDTDEIVRIYASTNLVKCNADDGIEFLEETMDNRRIEPATRAIVTAALAFARSKVGIEASKCLLSSADTATQLIWRQWMRSVRVSFANPDSWHVAARLWLDEL